jgi:hypothetical protein
LIIVPARSVVEGAVRLHIAHPRTRDTREAIQRSELIDHIVGQARRIDVDAAATEAGQIPIADLGTDRDAAAYRGLADPAHDVRVAGMKAAGKIRARNDIEQRRCRHRASKRQIPRRGRY